MARPKSEQISHEQRINNGDDIRIYRGMPLEEYCAGYPTQVNAANALGKTQPALSKMLNSETQFIVIFMDHGPECFPGRVRR